MLEPTTEQLALLTPTERAAYRFSDFFNQRLKFLSRWWIETTMRAVLWFTAGNRLRIHGREHLETLDDPSISAIMVANHRSFFDFFVVAYALVGNTRFTRRAFFPVRSTFFYEGPTGIAINMATTGMAMFPPIFRERQKGAFNQYAIDRIAAELRAHPTFVGIHPEGRRNKDPDQYALLKPQSGVGRIALACDGVRVVPMFIKGMSSDLVVETWRNWAKPKQHPIHLVFGGDVTVDDLYHRAGDREAWQEVSRRCMDAVSTLAEDQRRRDGAPARKPDLRVLRGRSGS
jgi:1-acyl-sn-glycerol-3-phosphate acyltransferase